MPRTATLILLGLAAALLLSAGCASIAGDYRVPDGFNRARSYSSVAGDIQVGRSARIGNAKTVSGNIEIGETSRVGSLSSVAGRIRVGADGKVEGSVKTVAGEVIIARGCTVGGDVGTVAGHITVTDSVVKGNVTLTSGRLELLRSRVAGTVRVERADDKDAETAEVIVGPDSEVTALVVETKARVHLKIHRTAKVGSIKGVEAGYYD